MIEKESTIYAWVFLYKKNANVWTLLKIWRDVNFVNIMNFPYCRIVGWWIFLSQRRNSWTQRTCTSSSDLRSSWRLSSFLHLPQRCCTSTWQLCWRRSLQWRYFQMWRTSCCSWMVIKLWFSLISYRTFVCIRQMAVYWTDLFLNFQWKLLRGKRDEKVQEELNDIRKENLYYLLN